MTCDEQTLREENAALRAVIERVERRVGRLDAHRNSLPFHAGGPQRAVLALVIGGLRDDLGDGQCRCQRLNGVGRYFSPNGIACEHGKNDTTDNACSSA